jgi:hypothetical protein
MRGGKGETMEITIQDLNRFPVNERARQMLEGLGEAPRETCLHCVQLALWTIEKGGLEAGDEVRETVGAMTTWTPVRLVNFLIYPRYPDCYEPAGWDSANDARALASCILHDIEERMMTYFPFYCSAE